MADQISKTARASMSAGEGIVKRTAVAWVFRRRVGKLQARPLVTCYARGEAETIVAADPAHLFLVSWQGSGR